MQAVGRLARLGGAALEEGMAGEVGMGPTAAWPVARRMGLCLFLGILEVAAAEGSSRPCMGTEAGPSSSRRQLCALMLAA